MNDKYVGCFVGWRDDLLDGVEQSYFQFERDVRDIFGLPHNYEVKSQLVKLRWYENGIASFRPQSIELYQRFFDFLLDTGAMFQMDVLSKIWLFMVEGMGFRRFVRTDVSRDTILYTLVKFIETYADDALMDTVVAFCQGKIDGYKLNKDMIRRLDEVILYNGTCNRKQDETGAYRKLRRILSHNKPLGGNDTVSFDYDGVVRGLDAYLRGYDICRDDVRVFVDDEQNTYDVVSSVFPKSEQVDSKSCFGVRAADLLAGFVSRMLRAINIVTLPVMQSLPGSMASEECVWVPKSWFDLGYRHEVFDLYKTVGSFMTGNSLPYWTVLVSKYGDEVSMFFSLLRYFGKFSTFDEFARISVDVHLRRFNEFSLRELSVRINNL